MVCEWQVEIDQFCQKVLANHWPDVRRHGDVRECGAHNLKAVDLICGGFPCQPFSQAGKQRGEQDDRNLWPQMRRIVTELRPRWVLAENVPGIRNIYLDTILSDLESLDYTAGTLDLPAVAFGAPHIRHRLFIVAHADRCQQGGGSSRSGKRINEPPTLQGMARKGYTGIMAHTNSNTTNRRSGDVQMGWIRSQGQAATDGDEKGAQWAIEPDVGRVAHGVPDRMDRLRALGNAVVPQVAEWIGRQIVQYRTHNCRQDHERPKEK